jgi:hypothetical protein
MADAGLYQGGGVTRIHLVLVHDVHHLSFGNPPLSTWHSHGFVWTQLVAVYTLHIPAWRRGVMGRAFGVRLCACVLAKATRYHAGTVSC